MEKLSKLKFILSLMGKGFSYKDALIASMFEICCHDYPWLARRSRKTLSYLIDSFKAKYGEDAHKIAHRIHACPNARIVIFQIWRDYGFIPPANLSKKANKTPSTNKTVGGSGAGKTRHQILPTLSEDSPHHNKKDTTL